MKQKFSTSWLGSKIPRKQVKYRANAPLHLRHKMISVNLSKDLRKKYGKRNFPLRKEDVVRILSGEFKRKTGKIDELNMKKLKVTVGGINRTKRNGTKLKVWLDPSNLQIQELNLEDRKRVESLNRKIKSEIKTKEDKK